MYVTRNVHRSVMCLVVRTNWRFREDFLFLYTINAPSPHHISCKKREKVWRKRERERERERERDKHVSQKKGWFPRTVISALFSKVPPTSSCSPISNYELIKPSLALALPDRSVQQKGKEGTFVLYVGKKKGQYHSRTPMCSTIFFLISAKTYKFFIKSSLKIYYFCYSEKFFYSETFSC